MAYSVFINNEKYASFADRESAKRYAKLKRNAITKVELKEE
jgi:hypothetical protein